MLRVRLVPVAAVVHLIHAPVLDAVRGRLSAELARLVEWLVSLAVQLP